ncbi:MAG: 50S ribosomal protein L10, partial [Clostridia bacterium]|nr:50S ribosomal protein L10 [Clostridia bacterium]
FSNDDEVSVPKILLDVIDKTKKIKIKFGVLAGRAIDSSSVEILAKLPSKEILIAMLLGILQEPVRKVMRVLNAPTLGLVTALDAVAKK